VRLWHLEDRLGPLTRTVTEPHLPLSLVGREWGRPRLAPQ
jgi:hypothetical protein